MCVDSIQTGQLDYDCILIGHFLCGRVLPNEISVIGTLLQSLLARS